MECVAPLLKVLGCYREVELFVVERINERLVGGFPRFVGFDCRFSVVLVGLVLLVVLVVGTLYEQRKDGLVVRKNCQLVEPGIHSVDTDLDNEIDDVPKAAYSDALAAELGDELMHFLEHGRVVLCVVNRDSEHLQRVC